MAEVTRLFELIYHQKEKFPQEKAFGSRRDGEWKFYSTDEVIDLSLKVASGLLKLGLKPGDKIATATYQNRAEWTVVDLGILQAGMINVPVYPTISPSDYEYIFNDAEVKYAFVGAKDLYDKVESARPKVKSLQGIFTFDRQDGRPFWEEVLDDSRLEEVEKISAGIDPKSLATIIYTSGTTGNPKGVMLNHENIIHVVSTTAEILPNPVPGEKVLSFLPLCHIFERAVAYGYMSMGLSVHFTGTDNLGGDDGDLKAVKPVFFTTVPRLLEKVYEAIYARGLALTGLKKKLFFWALGLTETYDYDKEFGGFDKFKRGLADKLVFSKWREALGGNVRGIVTGAAPCPHHIARIFSAAGIPIREGYGLTETSPTLTVNKFDKDAAMLGTVGPVLRGVEIMIDASDGVYRDGEGEILANGPNIMMGYYNKPDATAEVMKEIDGKTWFCTGDIGTFVDGPGGKQFLKITDRKKQLLKTSGGKYVAPAPIENKFKEDFLVEQIMVVGESRKFVSAVIVPAEGALKDWCIENDLEWTNLADMVNNPRVLAQYQSILDRYNPGFSHIEQIKKFTLLDSVWAPVTTDGSQAELTPTMKLKRRVILDKYKDAIEDMYQG